MKAKMIDNVIELEVCSIMGICLVITSYMSLAVATLVALCVAGGGQKLTPTSLYSASVRQTSASLAAHIPPSTNKSNLYPDTSHYDDECATMANPTTRSGGASNWPGRPFAGYVP